MSKLEINFSSFNALVSMSTSSTIDPNLHSIRAALRPMNYATYIEMSLFYSFEVIYERTL
jgi:hypothetical protein